MFTQHHGNDYKLSDDEAFLTLGQAIEFAKKSEWQSVFTPASIALSYFKENPQYRMQQGFVLLLLGKYYLNSHTINVSNAKDHFEQAKIIYQKIGIEATSNALLAAALENNCLAILTDYNSSLIAIINNILKNIDIEEYRLNPKRKKLGIYTGPDSSYPALREAFFCCQVTLTKLYYAKNNSVSIQLAEDLTDFIAQYDSANAATLLLTCAQRQHLVGNLEMAKINFSKIRVETLVLHDRFIYHYEFAHCLWLLKEINEAIQHLHQALKICPSENELYYCIACGLAVCHAQKGGSSTATNFIPLLQTFISSNASQQLLLKKLILWQPAEIPLIVQPIFDLLRLYLLPSACEALTLTLL